MKDTTFIFRFPVVYDDVVGSLQLSIGDEDYARSALAWAVGVGLINGTPDENGNIVLNPQGSATRAQIAAIIERFCENVVR